MRTSSSTRAAAVTTRRPLERLDAVLDEVQDALLAALTATERRTFVRLLAKLS